MAPPADCEVTSRTAGPTRSIQPTFRADPSERRGLAPPLARLSVARNARVATARPKTPTRRPELPILRVESERMLNAFTIDLEDWAQAVLDPCLPVTEHVLANTERTLSFLDRAGVKATFFALGKVCERFPTLLPDVAGCGHEIASHGYGHQLAYRQTPGEFEADVRRSIEIIASQIGRRPLGYRAPAFSITRQSLWAGPILARLGFRFSSSIFPVAKRRYGIPDAPRFPYRWPDVDLIEFPLTTLRFAGRNWPACGGGYTRLLPAAVLAHAIRRMNEAGHPAVIYLHPCELVPGEVRDFIRRGIRVSAIRRLTQELWRSRVAPRLTRLLDEFQFGTISAALQAIHLPRRAVATTEATIAAAPSADREVLAPC